MARSDSVTDAEVAQVRTLLAEDVAPQAIANALGRSLQTVEAIRVDSPRCTNRASEADKCRRDRLYHAPWDAQVRKSKPVGSPWGWR
jgi:hypothetical protein